MAFLRNLHALKGGRDESVFNSIEKAAKAVVKDPASPERRQLERFLIGLYFVFYGNEEEKAFAKEMLTKIKSTLFGQVLDLSMQYQDEGQRNSFLRYTVPALLRASANRSEEEIIKLLKQRIKENLPFDSSVGSSPLEEKTASSAVEGQTVHPSLRPSTNSGLRSGSTPLEDRSLAQNYFLVGEFQFSLSISPPPIFSSENRLFSCYLSRF